jgi:hypothetical protein
MNVEDLRSPAGRPAGSAGANRVAGRRMWPDRRAGVCAGDGPVISRVRSAADWFSVRDPGWGRTRSRWSSTAASAATAWTAGSPSTRAAVSSTSKTPWCRWPAWSRRSAPSRHRKHGQLRGGPRHAPGRPGRRRPAPRRFARTGSRPAVTPLIETRTTTIAAFDRRAEGGGSPERASSGKHVHGSGQHVRNVGKHVYGQRSRLTADDADLARTLTALHDLDRCLISIGAGSRT